MEPGPRREVLKRLGGAALAWPMAALADDRKPAGKPIRIGQIGVGHAHASKLDVYRRSPDYEVVGVVEPDVALRKQVAGQRAFKDLKWMTRDQLLNVPGLQAVLIETQVRDLLSNAEVCIDAGKHIHLDKPAGESLPALRRLLSKAAKRKLLVQMGYMFRYNPAVVLLRDFLKKGWLGEPFEVHAVISKVVDPAERRKLAEYPGGMMFELGCHVVDLVVGLLGKPLEVSAFPQHAGRLDDRLMDNMLAVFTYAKATATVKSSALEVAGFDRRHLVLCGTEGTFHIQPLDNPSARVALAAARGDYKKGPQDVRFPKFTRYVADAADMASVLRGEKTSSFSYEHDLAVQETLLKACGLGRKAG